MLVLSRKTGQRIVIGDDVVVSIIEIRGNTVRLGIDAPRYVPVYREEVITRAKSDVDGAFDHGSGLLSWPAT